jgi:protein-tyrosine kinase
MQEHRHTSAVTGAPIIDVTGALDGAPAATPRRQLMVPSQQASGFTGETSGALLLERFRQFSLSVFYSDQAPVHSLGFTSSVAGEGKSFLARVVATIVAHDTDDPVTLVECNWEHPTVHEDFDIPATPGLAEWLRDECDEKEVRHRINNNLTVVPAGDGKRDAVKLLQRLRQEPLLGALTHNAGVLILDLPPVSSCAYGPMAATLAETLVIVVRAGVTPDVVVADTFRQLKDSPVRGILLNQVESRIPKWLSKLM